MRLHPKALSCPTCGAWTRVLETRGIIRKRECANNHRFYTSETLVVPKENQVSDEQIAFIKHAMNVIEDNHGNISASARELNMRRHTLATIIGKYNAKIPKADT